MSTALTADAQLTTANICEGADFQALAATQLGSGPVSIYGYTIGEKRAVVIKIAAFAAALPPQASVALSLPSLKS
ncbi:hypothetical protein PybrP1_007510 [[Pythium] brassicae (nom. inval.)]|nr:hypothetical protein PybrP1_007510 [[Pythium] brassicae (nom. inval.)]